MKIFLTLLTILYICIETNSECTITNPEYFSIIQTDWIKLQLNCENASYTPDSVIYIVTYHNPSHINNNFWDIKSIKTEYPFEYLLDVKNMRDLLLFVKASIYNNGKLKKTLGTNYNFKGIPVIIDRNNKFKKIFCKAIFLKGKNKYEKLKKQLVTFNNQNNKISFSMGWDHDSIYAYVQVKDRHLNLVKTIKSDYGIQKNYFDVLWTSDGIELCFDFKNNHNIWKEKDDIEFITNISGRSQGNIWDAKKKLYLHCFKNANVKYKINGTVNQNNDIDTGYTIKISLPIKKLDIKINNGDTIGFDFQSFDLDSKNGTVFRSLWSKSDLGNNDNPSEWGDLILTKERHLKYIWTASIIIAIIIFIIIYHVKKKIINNKNVLSKSNLAESIQNYINLNYSLPELNRHNIAKQFNLNEYYLSTFFKKNTNTNLIDYINITRINHAKDLLTNNDKSISDIAFSVGYNTIQNFNINFKKITGMSPSEYRSKNFP